jgi:hypothetical protein
MGRFVRFAIEGSEIALDLLRGASALLGPRVPANRAFAVGPLSYLGHDAVRPPLLDMVTAGPSCSATPAATCSAWPMRCSLATASPPRAPGGAAIATARPGEAQAEAQIAPQAPRWNDLVPVICQVRALLDALQQPETAQLDRRSPHELHRSVDIDPATRAVTGSSLHEPDRTRPDRGRARRAVAAAVDVLFRKSNIASGRAFRTPRVRAVTRAVVRLAGPMFTGHDAADPGVPAIAAIADGAGEVDRRHPGTELDAAWTADDFASVLGSVAGFLREQQRGLPRFIAIVQGRNP